jgi:hypothetical protein
MRDFTRPLHNLRTETCDDPKHAPVVLAVGSTTQDCAVDNRWQRGEVVDALYLDDDESTL